MTNQTMQIWRQIWVLPFCTGCKVSFHEHESLFLLLFFLSTETFLAISWNFDVWVHTHGNSSAILFSAFLFSCEWNLLNWVQLWSALKGKKNVFPWQQPPFWKGNIVQGSKQEVVSFPEKMVENQVYPYVKTRITYQVSSKPYFLWNSGVPDKKG